MCAIGFYLISVGVVLSYSSLFGGYSSLCVRICTNYTNYTNYTIDTNDTKHRSFLVWLI